MAPQAKKFQYSFFRVAFAPYFLHYFCSLFFALRLLLIFCDTFVPYFLRWVRSLFFYIAFVPYFLRCFCSLFHALVGSLFLRSLLLLIFCVAFVPYFMHCVYSLFLRLFLVLIFYVTFAPFFVLLRAFIPYFLCCIYPYFLHYFCSNFLHCVCSLFFALRLLLSFCVTFAPYLLDHFCSLFFTVRCVSHFFLRCVCSLCFALRLLLIFCVTFVPYFLRCVCPLFFKRRIVSDWNIYRIYKNSLIFSGYSSTQKKNGDVICEQFHYVIDWPFFVIVLVFGPSKVTLGLITNVISKHTVQRLFFELNIMNREKKSNKTCTIPYLNLYFFNIKEKKTFISQAALEISNFKNGSQKLRFSDP